MLVSHKRNLYNFGIEVKIADISYNGAVYFMREIFIGYFIRKKELPQQKIYLWQAE